LAETTPNSIEPEYQEHRKKELLNIAQKSVLILAVALIFRITFFNQLFNTNQLFNYSVIQLLSYSVTQLFSYSVIQLLFWGSCYLALTLSIHLFVPKFNAGKMVPILRQAVNAMKADEEVFKALLKQQPFCETNDCDSIIRFGNPDSPLRITVLTNPYCHPCSMMHKRIEKLLKKVNNNIRVQYFLLLRKA
jgi:thiol-disulfide isomerase/thioredoxin